MKKDTVSERKPLIIRPGPTAVGKTAASIGLAKAIGGEIISADSMQVYRHMDIGSAKIRPKEMRGISHHLIDVLEPEEEFHVVKFQQMAKEALDGIYQRGHIPIVVGGTGFYIQALLYDIDFEKMRRIIHYRKELEDTMHRKQGAEELHS
ncbi:MAG: tRNA (adenosine(37)-N6)-dimethylallyltransferase [Mediterraneibacter gnavus]